MAKWTLEPGHTAAGFRIRHMMVTWVRGSFKPVTGTIVFDPENPARSSVDITINAKDIWTGDNARDDHLRTADFLDTKKHPTITFKGKDVNVVGENEFQVTGDLTIRGVTKKATLDVHYLGRWNTPFWVDNEDKGPVPRAGFVAKTKINRQDFGISWNSKLDKGGVVVGNDVHIIIDAEALLDKK